jgi:hypothetical protein
LVVYQSQRMNQDDGFFRRPVIKTWVEAGDTMYCCYMLGLTRHVSAGACGTNP